MAKAKNKVIAGEYMGWNVSNSLGILTISGGFFSEPINLDSSTVEAYELVTDEHRKSAVSGAARGLVGGALLGPVGALAGGLSATSKGIYQVAVQFKNGNKSLLEVDDKLYKAIIANCFAYSDNASSSNDSSNDQINQKIDNSSNVESSVSDYMAMVSQDDNAYGDNVLDIPGCKEKPYNYVNDYNKKIAVDAVSAVDKFFDNNNSNIVEQLKEYEGEIDEGEENDSLEQSHTKLLKTSLGLISALASIELGEAELLQIQKSRNDIARMYIVNEHFNPNVTSEKVLNTIQDYMMGNISPEIAEQKLLIYDNTLRAYIAHQNYHIDGPIDYETVQSEAHKIAWSFNPYSEQLSMSQIRNIADEIEEILKSDVSGDTDTADENNLDETNDIDSISTPDEIREYKKLLDEGIITEEEFDAKKKQLLGI